MPRRERVPAHERWLSLLEVPGLGRRVFRLGLATNYGVEGQDLEWALDLVLTGPKNRQQIQENLHHEEERKCGLHRYN